MAVLAFGQPLVVYAKRLTASFQSGATLNNARKAAFTKPA
jgi:hypothetical protein